AVSTIGELPPAVPGTSGALVAASPERVALAEQTLDSDGHITSLVRRQLLTGPVAGPLELLAGCGLQGAQCNEQCIGFGSSYSVDVSGTSLAYVGACSQDRLTVIDYGPNGPQTQTLAHVESVKIAGRYLAWVAQSSQFGFDDTLVVYDRQQNQEVYRLSVRFTAFPLDRQFDV